MSEDTKTVPLAVVDPPKKILEKDFQMEEQFVYARSSVTLPVGWAFEDCLKPEFWTHIAPKFQRDAFTNHPERSGGVIVVRSADHSFYAELYVRAVTSGGLIVGVVREPVYFGPKSADTAGYEVRWNVGKRSFDIIRKSDKEIVADAKTRELAAEWIGKTAGTLKAA